jgi:AraC-like DNA-binding protein
MSSFYTSLTTKHRLLVRYRFKDVRYRIMSDHQRHPDPARAQPWATAVRHRIPPLKQGRGLRDWWVLGICLSGDSDYGGFRLRARDALLIRPRTPVRWQAQSAWDIVSCTFAPAPHWQPLMDWEEVAPGFLLQRLSGRAWSEARRRGLEAVEATESGRSDATAFAANAIEALLLHCHRARHQQHSGADPRLRQAVEALEGDLAGEHRIDHLARRCGLSRAQLARLFRQQLGISPMGYLARLRVQHASRLLRLTELPIKRIALEVGFPDQRYFSSWFRRQTGRTPRERRCAAD